MKFNVRNEVAQIVGRQLTTLEGAYVRAKAQAGMVNPYDIISSAPHLFK